VKTLIGYIRRDKEREEEKGNLPKEANSNAKLILTMSEILKRTS